MASYYVETPLNFASIEPYIESGTDEIVHAFISTHTIFFYDTCSFRYHSRISDPKAFFDFIKLQNGLVVITRCVLMELASHSGILNQEYLEYFRKMHLAGIKVLVMWEEDLFGVFDECFTANTEINRRLSQAVKVVKRATGTVENTLQLDRTLCQNLMKGVNSDSLLFQKFFSAVRRNKEEDDNLGEELLCICMHMLSDLDGVREYQFLVLTDDKGAIGWLNRTRLNVVRHGGINAFSVFSTARLLQRMVEEGIITGKTEVEEVLDVSAPGGALKVLGSEMYDLEPKEKTMTCEALAELIVGKKIHINY